MGRPEFERAGADIVSQRVAHKRRRKGAKIGNDQRAFGLALAALDDLLRGPGTVLVDPDRG